MDEIEVSTVSLDECGAGETYITFNTNIEGVADVTLDFPPYANGGSEDVVFPAEAIGIGANTVQWDKLDGNGNLVSDGTVFKIGLFIGGSIVHLPLYDIEGLTGLKARLVRPGTPDYIGLYWDNGNIGNTVVATDPGCVSSSGTVCNDYGYGNEQTLNVWWNGLDVNVEADVIVPTDLQVSLSIANSQPLCNESGILVLMDARAENINSVEWKTSGTGYFDNPNIPDATYYASTQDSLNGFVSLTLSGAACPDLTDSRFIGFDSDICALPITLSAFSAVLVNANEACDGVKVGWTTQTEDDTDYFALERSTDGLNFREVGRIQAAGTSLTPKDYVLIDKNVGTKNYYRLTIYDLDGSSESILLNYVVYTDCFIDVDINNISDVFPNPVREEAYVRINIKEATHVNVNIIDISND